MSVFQSLPEPGAHLFQLDWLAHEPLGCYVLCVSKDWGYRHVSPCSVFMWVLGIRTRVLMLAQ